MENKKEKASERSKILSLTFLEKLLLARQEMPTPKRSGFNKYTNSKYVTLQDLYEATLPSLLKYGLFMYTKTEYVEGVRFVNTYIQCVKSKEYIHNTSMLNLDLKIQEEGGAITYKTRYNIGSLLSIRVDFDDDAESIKDVKPSKDIKKEQNELISELMEWFSDDEKKKNHGFCYHNYNQKKVDELNDIERSSFIKFLENKKRKMMREQNA